MPKVSSAGWVVAGALALVLWGCSDRSKTKGLGCEEDSDCGQPASAHRCEPQTGACFCRTNEACPSRQFCNTAGFCQDKSGCEKNADCLGSDLFCDTSSGTCLSYGKCSNDLHCPLGQVCDARLSVCIEGCRTDGDCPGSSCRCGDRPCACPGGSDAERQACEVGVCDPYFCSDKTFCRFGELCGPPDGGTGQNECYSDYDPDRRPYCSNCSFGAGISTCGSGPNYCLIDTANPGNYYCGADCSDGQECPRGYRCADVIVVFTQWACTPENPYCPPNPSLPCTEDTDCKRGGTCLKQEGSAQGQCAGACRVGEGRPTGFCSCQVDADCAQESCSQGECSISRRPCVDTSDCRPIRCVDFNGSGGCLIGQNCAPGDGLTCLDLQ